MSYLYGASLQAAVYRRLTRDPNIVALVGTSVFDAPPEAAGPEDGETGYVTIGEETVRSFDTKTSRGASHDFVVTVHSGRSGFDAAKRIAAAICSSLLDASLDLDAGRLVDLRFVQARAERNSSPERRRIALRFRAVVDQDDPSQV